MKLKYYFGLVEEAIKEGGGIILTGVGLGVQHVF